MDRYYKDKSNNIGRSHKNQELYKQIEDLDSYTNIEGVATIENTNEIDISKVKEMLKNRENYKKQKYLRSISPRTEEKDEIYVMKKEEEPEKNYDINDIINKMKNESKEDDFKYRKLDEEQYDVLRSLNKRGIKQKKYDEEKELKELLNTIVSKNKLDDVDNKDTDTDSDVGLLDELKSDTVVGDASSIKKIIEEEKFKTEDKTEDEPLEIDKSFYTSSFGFTQRDFEELKSMNHTIKKSNKFIIILLIVLILMVISGVLYLVLR